MFKFDFYSAAAEEEPAALANATKSLSLTEEDNLPARHNVARKIQPGDGAGESSLLRLLSFPARVHVPGSGIEYVPTRPLLLF